MSALEQVVPEGYKQTEVGLIPINWSLKKLEHLTSLIIDGTHHTPTYTSFGVPFLRVTDIQGPLDDSKFKYVSEQEHKVLIKRCKPELGDLLLSKNGTIGIPKVVDWEWEFSVFVSLALIKPIKKLLNSSYLEQYFKSDFLKLQLSQRAKQGTVTNLHLEEIRELLIPVPEAFKEQTAIANALSDVDALLTELEKLLSKKQAIKTATMQQLLTGKTRLPQFSTYIEGEKQGLPKGTKSSELGEIPEDWDVVSLGDIGNTVIGLTYSPNDVAEYGTLVLRSSNVQKNTLAYENNVFVDMDLPERVIVKEGDILVCVRNGSRNLIGKCALIDKYAEGSAFGAFMSIYRTKQSKFIFFQFQSNVIQNQINEIMGATINQITNKDMAAFKVPLPSDEKEQTAIATILSDMDNEIQTLEQRLAKTRQIKQGMMQELLTGRTRLPF